MQFKSITVLTVLLLVVASLFVAGCTTSTTSNTSNTNQSDNATSFTDGYIKDGYILVKPFTKGTNQYGNDIYMGVVRDNSSSRLTVYEHNITVEVMKSPNETKERAAQLTELFVTQGYPRTNFSTGLVLIQNKNDTTLTISVDICPPNMRCTGLYQNFNQFTIGVDRMKKLE